MNLSEVKKGSIVQIIRIEGGLGIIKRLAELGMYKGTRIQVEKNSTGPLILNVLNCKIAVGRGQARKIEVI
ncbi:MAG: FeoA family protein [Candidatus Micrarchaeia archaeon]|jgi:ferrous iron transport protein A